MPFTEKSLDSFIHGAVAFISENFCDEVSDCILMSEPVTVLERVDSLHDPDMDGFDDYLTLKEPDFSEILYTAMQDKGFRAKDIIERSGLSRAAFFKLQNGDSARPRRDSAIALAFAFGMKREEAEDFLDTAGYSLSRSSRRDLLFMYCFDHISGFESGVTDVNIVLDRLNMPLIGKAKE